MSHVYVDSTVDLSADVIDVRDIIARVLELRDERDEYNEKMGSPDAWDGVPDGEPEELAMLEYAQDLAEDCGMVDTNARWPMNCIDWEQAARELQMDYSNILIHDSTYWYR